MTQVDFYVLPETTSEARWLFACRLIEKVQRMGMDILVAVDNPEQAREFDELLWTFKPESFIPHQLLDIQQPAPVQITYNQESGNHQGLLLNLSSGIPPYFDRFARLSEIVIQEEKALKTSRERFSFYKGRGYPIETRKL
ncbi:DNA polymerase III subunit chi [Cellvibrio japonicus]|uniref:DNA polymerase III, chi subunit n=1 Tax=Cellvibrio japonicus (strain Ueda107) TaxID=498211 RepID=B3PDI9_CELJU|nr:DNA polymerase III subunit chi [Cellvibrio japonicus]ACE85801.1 DNA polymerase III, chi subunit [Cellvibrio japonicus Ueda107]QEI12007.1 DNA polymerase III subunit chi [Cellvibrio japonicus]QEI15582.1 DNA polymerase III subunit chi [Cellvibrio japonicus]QEI19160.1 DNA polymerase III subunit chi [Cellvibrio japonicus]